MWKGVDILKFFFFTLDPYGDRDLFDSVNPASQAEINQW